MILRKYFFVCLCFSVIAMGCAGIDKGQFGSLASKPVSVGIKRPFRTGMMKMHPYLDLQKPLAPADYVGWVESAGMLLGNPEEGVLLAVDLKTRSKVWAKALKGGDLTVPVFPVGDSLLTCQKDGTLSKLDSKTGSVIWEYKLPTFVSVNLSNDQERIYAITSSQVLYAINFHDGKMEWLYDPEVNTEIKIQNAAPPLVSVGKLYWGLTTGELMSLEAKTGKRLWRRNPKYTIGGRFHNYAGSLVVSNKLLAFCRYDGLIGAVSTESGQEGELRWQLDSNSGNCSDADSRGGLFYAVTSKGEVYSINIDNGATLWSSKLGPDLSSVFVLEDSIFASSTEGQIYNISMNGQLIWFDNLEARILSHPFLFDKQIYFSTGLKNIYSYKT